MCRLFGLHAGRTAVTATFWLLDAPDNLVAQSRRNPDGTGLGVFDAQGRATLRKQPMAAWHDRAFASEAHHLTGTTFIAHVRYATTGALDVADTHPFLQDGRMLAHNGVVGGLDVLDERLTALGVSDLVAGQTDSERLFAAITAAIRSSGGDVQKGLIDAVGWVAANLPLYALNLILTTATDLWALRYPDTHELYVLDRRSPPSQNGPVELRSARISARSEDLTARPSVVVASEPMDDDPRWRLLEAGELLHVDADLSLHSEIRFPNAPAHLLTRAELSPAVAAAQHETGPIAVRHPKAVVRQRYPARGRPADDRVR